MTIQEFKSSLFYIKGDGKLEIAYGNDDSSSPVERGRCLYLVRLELASVGHPEIQSEEFDLAIATTKDRIYWSKGLGGSKRGWCGKEIPFENLIEKAQFPDKRVDQEADKSIRDVLTDILGEYHYNCNFRVYSEFEGYRQGFGSKFDRIRTYLPIIKQAVNEVIKL